MYLAKQVSVADILKGVELTCGVHQKQGLSLMYNEG